MSKVSKSTIKLISETMKNFIDCSRASETNWQENDKFSPYELQESLNRELVIQV